MDEGIVIFDRNLKVLRINQKAKDLLMVETIDAPFDFVTNIKGKFKIQDEKTLDNIGLMAITTDLERAETEQFKSLFLAIRTMIIREPSGEIANIVMLVRDVTEERREEMLKQNFLDLVSHKLNTPISVILGWIPMLQDESLGSLNEKKKLALKSLSKNAYELKSLIGKLLSFTTISQRKLELTGQRIELAKYLPILRQTMVKHYPEKKIELNIQCPDIMLKINQTHFDLIINNLLENAIKFNDKDIIKIDILAETSGDKVKISVLDNGPSIPPEEKERIFEKFYQIEKNFTGQVEGLGLGLALVKRLVSAYGGQIQLESNPGKGNKFIFTLPVDN
jgi:signal transduction histidine kinase